MLGSRELFDLAEASALGGFLSCPGEAFLDQFMPEIASVLKEHISCRPALPIALQSVDYDLATANIG